MTLPSPGDALILVDVQQDFLPGGALAVPRGDEVIAPLNRYIELFTRQQLPIFASRDWHPTGHCSFAASGGRWPAHCVMSTAGAGLSPDLQLPAEVRIISKAMHPSRDAYSAFEETDLAEHLRRLQVVRLWVGGLATDYCVLATVRDARALGLNVVVLTDAVRGMDEGQSRQAIDQMLSLGAVATSLRELSGRGEPRTG